jgi:hypothetical protein
MNTFDEEVERVLNLMSDLDPTGDDYKKAVESLKTLCEARSKKPAFPIDLETILMVGSNLLAVVLILQHERLNVISTRAIGFIRK